MSSLKSSQKPTLGMILQNPQSQSVVQNSPEKVVFPKINTKLKKTQFTKYRSAFISAQSCDLYLQSDRSLKTPQYPTVGKLNTETILKQENWQSRAKIQLRKNLWKLNKNHHESYLSASTQKVNLSSSQIKEVQNSKIQRKDKILIEPSHSTEIKRNDRVVLLTEIRQLDISPIQYAQTSREERPKPRKSEEINENIQRSNRMISLIEKNYRKGFFENSAQKDSLEKLQEKLGLFSYLKRNFVTKKEKLTPEKVREYFKTPSNKKLETKIDLVARSFLKQKMQGDYHSYQQVNKVRQQMSQQCIQKQIKQKNVEYRAEYNKKYNIPYLSFLSLPKKLKVKVLQNLSGQQKAKLK